MERSRVVELHYMTPIDNLASIASAGLLCHARAAVFPHTSIASEEVQRIRAEKCVPGGRPLHDYVNLYFDARNAMMRACRDDDPIVVRVSPAVMDFDGTVISDGNAAAEVTRFHPSPAGLWELDAERVYAEWWTHPVYWEHQERKRQRQAEVLVPDCVPPSYIIGCYAQSEATAGHCKVLVPHWTTEVKPHVYFD